MERPTVLPGRLGHAIRASLLLAAIVLGAAFHVVHHLQDPACDGGLDPGSHACVACAGLHASTLVAAGTHAPEPVAVAWAPIATALHARASVAVRGAAAPRAPPAA